MPQTIQDVRREERNKAAEEKGKKADTDADFAKSQEDAQSRLAEYAKKTNKGAAPAPSGTPPTQNPGESALAYAARKNKWKQDQQAAQSKALSK